MKKQQPQVTRSKHSPSLKSRFHPSLTTKKTGYEAEQMPLTAFMPKSVISKCLQMNLRPVLDTRVSRSKARGSSLKAVKQANLERDGSKRVATRAPYFSNQNSKPTRSSQVRPQGIPSSSQKRMPSQHQKQPRSTLPSKSFDIVSPAARTKPSQVTDVESVKAAGIHKLRMTTEVSYFDQPLHSRRKKALNRTEDKLSMGKPNRSALIPARSSFISCRSAEKNGHRSTSFISNRSANSQYQAQFKGRRDLQFEESKSAKRINPLPSSRVRHGSMTKPRPSSNLKPSSQFLMDTSMSIEKASFNRYDTKHEIPLRKFKLGSRDESAPQAQLACNQDLEEPDQIPSQCQSMTVKKEDKKNLEDEAQRTCLSLEVEGQQVPLTAKFGPGRDELPIIQIQEEPLSLESGTFRGSGSCTDAQAGRMNTEQKVAEKKLRKVSATGARKGGPTRKTSPLKKASPVKKPVTSKSKDQSSIDRMNFFTPQARKAKVFRFDSSVPFTQEKLLKQELKQKNRELLSNTSLRSLDVDNQTREQIQKLLERQAKQTLALQVSFIDNLNQEYEKKIARFMENQKSKLKSLVKANKHRSDSQVRELKKQVESLQGELEEVNRSKQRAGSYISQIGGSTPDTQDISAVSMHASKKEELSKIEEDEKVDQRARELLEEIDKKHQLERSACNMKPEIDELECRIFDPQQDYSLDDSHDLHSLAHKLAKAPPLETSSGIDGNPLTASQPTLPNERGATEGMFSLSAFAWQSRQEAKGLLTNATTSGLDLTGKSVKQLRPIPQSDQDSVPGEGLGTEIIIPEMKQIIRMDTAQAEASASWNPNLISKQDLQGPPTLRANLVRNNNLSPKQEECDITDEEDSIDNYSCMTGALNDSMIGAQGAHASYRGQLHGSFRPPQGRLPRHSEATLSVTGVGDILNIVQLNKGPDAVQTNTLSGMPKMKPILSSPRRPPVELSPRKDIDPSHDDCELGAQPFSLPTTTRRSGAVDRPSGRQDPS